MPEYGDPVARLLTLGKPDCFGRDDWQDYRQFGLAAEHVPELIRLACDRERWAEDTEVAATWGPVHAWRALGQLQAESAVAPLLQVLQEEELNDSDWGLTDIPNALAKIGMPAIPTLAAFLADPAVGPWSRSEAAGSLRSIARDHPGERDRIVALLTQELERFADNPEELNANLVSSLCSLKATECIDLIERAMAAGRVEEDFTGNWDWVRYDMGLGPKPECHRYPKLARFAGLRDAWESTREPGNDTRSREQKAKAKKKRKLAAQSRKRNRRR